MTRIRTAPKAGVGSTAGRTVAKRFASTAAGISIASTADIWKEWQTPGRLDFPAAVGDFIDCELIGLFGGSGARYFDYAIINPGTAAIIRRASPGAYGQDFLSTTADAVPRWAGSFVVQAADIVSGVVTVNAAIRSGGPLTVHGPPNYGFVTRAIHIPA